MRDKLPHEAKLRLATIESDNITLDKHFTKRFPTTVIKKYIAIEQFETHLCFDQKHFRIGIYNRTTIVVATAAMYAYRVSKKRPTPPRTEKNTKIQTENRDNNNI